MQEKIAENKSRRLPLSRPKGSGDKGPFAVQLGFSTSFLAIGFGTAKLIYPDSIYRNHPGSCNFSKTFCFYTGAATFFKTFQKIVPGPSHGGGEECVFTSER